MMTDLALFIYGKIFIMNRNLFLLATASVGEKNWEILSRRYTGKRVSMEEVKNGVQSLLLYLFETVLSMTLFSILT